MKRRKVMNFAKKIVAVTVATATMAVGAFSGMTFAQKEAEEKAYAASNEILSNEDRGVIYANSRTDFRDETIYFLITTRFYDGDSSNNARTSEDDNKAHNPEDDPSWRGDFAGLIEKLDYIKALGFTAIWITPVVENDSGYDYHGYHAYNFSAVDTRYESNGITYQDLIDAVHAKGMKIIQDVVLNHTCNWGEENLLQITSDVYSERNQVVMNGTGDPDNIYHHNGFCGGGDWDNYEAQRKTIADDCFDLETENPEVYNYLVDCYTDYIEMGVDGFRIDTVKHISRLTFNTVFLPAFKEAGGEDFYMFGEVCTKGHDVWYRGAPPISTCFYTWADSTTWTSQWSTDTASNEALVEAHYNANMDTSSQPTSNNAFLNGNEYHEPDYSQKSGMDVIDFQMHWSFNNANSAFSTALGEDKYFNDSTWNVVYVDSHDYAPDQCQTQRYTGGTDAWAENLSLMFTFRGIPCIYYGSEIEFQAGKPIDVGPSSPLSETGRAYYGDHIEGTVEATGFTVFDNLSGEVEDTLDSTLSQHIMRLNRLRQAIPALRKGQYSTENCSGNIAFKRRYTDDTIDSFALVAISGNATFTNIPNGTYVDAVTGDVKNVTNGTLTASVSGKANMKIYVLDTAKTPAPGRVIPNGDYLTDGGAATLIKNERVDDNTVKPTSITLNKTSVSILEGNTQTVTATVLPTDASNKKVTWTSSNTSVATVSGGTITGVSVGTATITAKTSNNLTATVTVTVSENPNIVKPTGVTVSPATLTLTEDDTSTVTATVTPSNAANKTVTWTSADTSVATVSSAGLVTAVSEGTTTITATTSNGLTAKVAVTVEGKEFPTIENGVYFEKPSSWGSTIYAYMWDSSTSEQLLGSWPGTKIDNLQDNIYGFSSTASEGNTMIIFNDGSSQTGDLTFYKNGYYDKNGLVKIITEQGKVVVNYEDEDGNILSTKSTSGDVGTSYTTSAITIEGYTLKTTPSNASGTYTSGTITVTYVYEPDDTIVELSTTLKVNGSSSTVNLTVGDSVAVVPTATGGSGSYTYKYVIKNVDTGATATLKDYSSSTSYTGTMSSVGTKQFIVYVKDSDGTVATSNAVTVVASEEDEELTAALKVNGSSSTVNLTVGDVVTVKPTASGGSGSYTYKYVIKNVSTGASVTLKNYSSATSYTGTMTSAGTKQFIVYVQDSDGTIVQTNAVTVVVEEEADELAASLKVNNTSSTVNLTVGDVVVVKPTATGGTGSYTYKYVIKNVSTGATATLKNYSSASSYTGTMTSAGTKQFIVYVKDSEGTVVQTNAVTVVTSEENEELSASLKVNGSSSTVNLTVGDSVTVKPTVTGGTGSYTYKYVIKNVSTGATATLKNYSSASSYTGTMTSVGTKQFIVYVKDSAGTVVQTNAVTVVTSEESNELSATLKVNNTTSQLNLEVGDVVVLKATATGGSESYTYKYVIRNSAGTEYTLQNYSSSTMYTGEMTSAGTKEFKVYVKDSDGTVVATNTVKVVVS